jgi:transcriptional regulator with XRE-family HTH domain
MGQLSAAQIRAARAIIGWSQNDLAEATRLGVRTIKRAEGGERLTDAADFSIRTAFEKAGVIFVAGASDLAGKEIVVGVALVNKRE